MPRRNDIESAFRAEMEIEKSGRRVYGVVTYVINDARGGEFDDTPF